jgi:putative hydrolase of the HAD superfamily
MGLNVIPKAIVFDFGNVIININPDLTYQSFADLTFKSPAKIKSLITDNDVFKKFETGYFNEEEFRDVIRQILGYPLNDNEIDTAWNALVLDVPLQRIKFLEELRTKYPIYLLSNTNSIHTNYSKKIFKDQFGYNNFLDLFQKAYLSFETKLFKPDNKIYEFIISDIGVKSEEILFLDDNQDNIDSACEMGIKGIKINPPEDFNYILQSLL